MEKCKQCGTSLDDYYDQDKEKLCYECCLDRISSDKVLIDDLLYQTNKCIFRCFDCRDYVLKSEKKVKWIYDDCLPESWLYNKKLKYCYDEKCRKLLCLYCHEKHEKRHESQENN